MDAYLSDPETETLISDSALVKTMLEMEAAQPHIIVFKKYNFDIPHQFIGIVHNFADNFFTSLIFWMGFTRKNNLEFIFTQSHQPVRIRENKLGPFIFCSTPGKTYGKHIFRKRFLGLGIGIAQ